ncbi:MAG: hypothetical protein H7061_01210 [Bdellovibrionaceae bacterium]|nr:hypothetical protein [Bdellovibrio sp.]
MIEETEKTEVSNRADHRSTRASVNATQASFNSIAPEYTDSAILEQSVHFRCPHCQKLYRTSQDVFDGASPEFDCSTCDKSFVLTSQIDSFGLYQTEGQGQIVFSNCPKCSQLKPQKSDECPSCGVFASKYEELQKVESPSLFELNQIWQKTIADFNNDNIHQDFLNRCQQKMALNFAFQKYSELKKTMGFDSVCEKYMKQIELRLERQFYAADAEVAENQKEFPLSQWVFLSVGILGMLLLIYNKVRPTFPNLTGLVVAVTVLSFGLGFVSSQRNRGIKL